MESLTRFASAFMLVVAALPACSLLLDFDSPFVDPAGTAGHAGSAVGPGGRGGRESIVEGTIPNLAGAAGAYSGGRDHTTFSSNPVANAGSSFASEFGGAGGVPSEGARGGTQAAGGGVGGAALGASAGAAGALGPLPAEVSITLNATTSRATLGQSELISVAVQRSSQNVGDIEIAIQGLPAGVASAPITIASTEGAGQLSLQVAPSATVGGPHSCAVVATSKSDPSISSQATLALYVVDRAGVRDLSFGGSLDGTVMHNLADNPGSVANVVVDTQGRAVAGGSRIQDLSTEYGWLVRLTASGALDASFATAGLYTDFGPPPTAVYQVALNGGLLYVSATNSHLPYLRRIQDNGLYDPTFGIGGDAAPGDGLKPLTAFRAGVVARTLATCQLRVFGEDGASDSAFPAIQVDAYAVAADSQERVVFAQSSDVTTRFRRLLSDGQVDSAFGILGEVEVYLGEACSSGFESTDYVSSLRVLPDNSLRGVFSCSGSLQGGRRNYEYFLVAIDAQGKIDTAFGSLGFARIAGSPQEVVDLIVQTDGKTVVLLSESDASKTPNEQRYLLTRLDTTGALDSTFGSAGVSRLDGYLYPPSPFGVPCADGTRSFCATALGYDQVAQRALVAGWIEGVGLGAVRVWL